MIDVRVYSIIILVICVIVLIVGYALIALFRPPPQVVNDTLGLLIYFIVLIVIFGLILILITTLVKPSTFIKSSSNALPQRQSMIPSQPMIPGQMSNNQTMSNADLKALIPPGPIFNQNQSSSKAPNFGGSTFITSYYQYDPNDKTLNKIYLDKITEGQILSDYFHRNDETIFTLDDGHIISVFGNDVQRIMSSPPIKKVRVLNGKYIGLSDGKLYTSSDLKTWTQDTTKPQDIVDFDVPATQTSILYLRTPNENKIIDTKTNNVLVTEKPEPKRFGSNINSYVKYTEDGVMYVNGNQQMFYKGYNIGDVDNTDRLYVVPAKLKDGYRVIDAFTADNNAIFKVESFGRSPDKINVGNEFIYK